MDFLQKNKKIIIVSVLILAPVMVALVFSNLNVFKIGPVQKEVKIEPIKIPPKPDSLQSGPYKCPSTGEFCQKGSDTVANNQYVGFGANISSGSAILASFDGKISTLTTTLSPQFGSETFTTIYLDNPERGLRAIYHYKGPETNLRSVKEGQKLSSVGEKIDYFNASLVFAVIKNYPSVDRVKLTSQDFK